MGRGPKRSRTSGGFVQLTWDMLNSRAYYKLSKAAGKMLPFFLGKVKVHPNNPGRYTEVFHFPYSEARKRGYAHSTFTTVIQDVIDKGFVDPVGKGGLRSYGLGCNTFKLSQRWMKYGTPNFESKKWEKLSPDQRRKKGKKKR